jgi:hypothetical protein
VRNGGTEELPIGRLEWIIQFNSTGSSGQRAVGLFREMKGQFGFSIRHGSPNSVHSLPRCELFGNSDPTSSFRLSDRAFRL